MTLARMIAWVLVAVVGATSVAYIALYRGETINSVWFLTAALCVGLLAYRFYSAFLAARVLALDSSRTTPAVRLNNGRDFVPTNRWIVFGHHFAAIAGPGPLIGPTLAAQFGYLPGTLWILVGAVLGGCVQDLVILTCSLRRNGRSLGTMARDELGRTAGSAAMVGVLAIMVILIAVLGLVVVNAMKHSPWATATVFATIPIAILIGFYMRSIRPGRILEGTLIGVSLLMLSVAAGGLVDAHPVWRQWFDFGGESLALMLILYGFAASAIPVWMLLAPRDYLSSFMKLGTVFLLAIAIVIIRPDMKMPALTSFIDGTGPIFAGAVFPFVFITIACGALSGFHALVCSGTTSKLLADEKDARLIGYGAMTVEMGVAVMAMIAACVLEPGVFFAINSPAGIVGASLQEATATISSWGFVVTPEQMQQLARQMGEETLLARTGGAPSLAVGMASLFSKATSEQWIAMWYHFAIMFEALFILTALDAGTRVGRFLLQDALGPFVPVLRPTSDAQSTIIASAVFCAAWGYFLYMGTIDPLGGINSLWPLFGISNQMLGVIALCVGTSVIVKSGKGRYVWTTAIPLVWMLIVTTTAAWHKIAHEDIRIGFLASAAHLQAQLDSGLIAVAAVGDVSRRIFNNYLNAAITLFFAALMWVMVIEMARFLYRYWRGHDYLPLAEARA